MRDRPLNWFVLLMAGAVALTARADVLTISAPGGQSPQLRLQGVGNKDYAIQTTGDLAAGNWLSLTTGATDATGLLQASDASGSSPARFYRAARFPDLQTTTSVAAIVPGAAVTITLGGSDPQNSGGTLSAIITQLPTSGTLAQFDGTPITAVGTVVTDSLNRVQFIAAETGSAEYANFSYEMQRVSNRVTSPAQTVAVHLHANWVFSSFEEGSALALQLSYSDDGVTWSNTGDLYRPASGDGVRDTSITRLNGIYYAAYTAGNFGGVPYVQIASSTDLVHWTYLCNVDTTCANNGYYSWAPEWFVDQDGSVYLYVSRALDNYQWRIYWTKPTSADLTTWAPIQRLGGDMADRGGIDPSVVRDGNVYYLAYRNYGAPGGTECIEMATGSTPTAFSLYKTGDWAGWGSPREAPSLVHLGGANWRIYYSLVVSSLDGSIIARSDSHDNMATWTAAAPTGLPSHGTCFLLNTAAVVQTNAVAQSEAARPTVKPATPKSLSTNGATLPSRGNRTF